MPLPAGDPADRAGTGRGAGTGGAVPGPVRPGARLSPLRCRVTTLVDKILALDESLDRGGFDHAFGGALALAWCTERAGHRGHRSERVRVRGPGRLRPGALPAGVIHAEVDRELLERDGQVRVWWDGTPVDLFLNTTDFHELVAVGPAGNRSRDGRFRSSVAPTSPCSRRSSTGPRTGPTWRRWRTQGPLDRGRVAEVLATYLGPGDERAVRVLGPDPAHRPSPGHCERLAVHYWCPRQDSNLRHTV